jgi:hypothetical protein
MKVKSIKSVYISGDELKEAISNWIMERSGMKDLSLHMIANPCEFDWSEQTDGLYLVVDIDGSFEENE